MTLGSDFSPLLVEISSQVPGHVRIHVEREINTEKTFCWIFSGLLFNFLFSHLDLILISTDPADMIFFPWQFRQLILSILNLGNSREIKLKPLTSITSEDNWSIFQRASPLPIDVVSNKQSNFLSCHSFHFTKFSNSRLDLKAVLWYCFTAVIIIEGERERIHLDFVPNKVWAFNQLG